MCLLRAYGGYPTLVLHLGLKDMQRLGGWEMRGVTLADLASRGATNGSKTVIYLFRPTEPWFLPTRCVNGRLGGYEVMMGRE